MAGRTGPLPDGVHHATDEVPARTISLVALVQARLFRWPGPVRGEVRSLMLHGFGPHLYGAGDRVGQ